MRVTTLVKTAGIATAAIALAACNGGSGGGGSSSGGSTSISGGGSSFQATIEQEWTGAFGGASVSYDGTLGSTTGQQDFEQGSKQYAGSDVVMLPADQKLANTRCGGPAITFPVTAGGIAIIYNLPSVKNLKLDPITIAKIFQGEITTWNDSAIAADNPGVKLPSTKISPFHRADGSGTTDVLSSYLTAEAPGVWKLGAATTLTWPKAAGASGTGSSTIAGDAAQTAGGITYAEASYVNNGLQAAVVQNAKKKYVALTSTAVSQSINTGFKITGTGDNLAGALNFPAMTGYPLSTVSYAIVCQKYSDTKTGTAIKNFFNYVITSGQSQAAALHYAPLPASLVSKDKTAVASIS